VSASSRGGRDNRGSEGDSGNGNKRLLARNAGDVASVVLGLVVLLLGTDPFQLRGKSHLLGGLNKVALALWIATILVLVSTALLPRKDKGGKPYRVMVAIVLGGAAAAVTFVMIGLSITGHGTDKDHVRVALSADNRAVLDRLCGTRGKPLTGHLATGSLEGAFTVLTLDHGLSVRCDDVRVRSTRSWRSGNSTRRSSDWSKSPSVCRSWRLLRGRVRR